MELSKLEIAKNKYKTSKVIDVNQNLIDYICECYVKLNPCSYGKRLQNYICNLLKLTIIKATLNTGDFKFKDTFGEFKVTFLGQNGEYTITHIRQWQKFKYYLIMFIDCENDFTPEFYFVPKNVMNKFKLGNMVGTKEANEDNHNVDLRVNVKKGSLEHKLLAKQNLLKGTSIDHLINYIDKNK
jgi:hypothetical protein